MLVIQSYRNHDIPSWIADCMRSVKDWAQRSGADYHCADDEELLGILPEAFKTKLEGRWPMLADLGRLKLIQKALSKGEERVVWLDADVYVLKPEALHIPKKLKHGYAFGREHWIETGGKARHGVHNAICVFDRNNPFLDFYSHACERIIEEHDGGQLAPQLIGPKFLKMQNSLLDFELMDSVAMLSPAVVDDLLRGKGALWDRQKSLTTGNLAAVNLCSSLIDDQQAAAVLDLIT